MCKKKKKVDLVHRVAQRCLRLTQGAAGTLAEEEEEEDQLVRVLSASQFVDVVIAVKKVSWPNPPILLKMSNIQHVHPKCQHSAENHKFAELLTAFFFPVPF